MTRRWPWRPGYTEIAENGGFEMNGGRNITLVQAVLPLLLAGALASSALAGAPGRRQRQKGAKAAAVTVAGAASASRGSASAGSSPARLPQRSRPHSRRPLPLLADGDRRSSSIRRRLATAYVDAAVGRARAAAAGYEHPLVISVHGAADPLRPRRALQALRAQVAQCGAGDQGRAAVHHARAERASVLDKKLLLRQVIGSLMTERSPHRLGQGEDLKPAVTAREPRADDPDQPGSQPPHPLPP